MLLLAMKGYLRVRPTLDQCPNHLGIFSKIIELVACPSARADKKLPARGIIERVQMIFDMG
jgi:hypothetical protein